jgi:glycosyltransferase involved in cell wall biosynthesis
MNRLPHSPTPSGAPRGYRILYHHRTQALDGQRVHIHEIQHALRRLGHQVLEVAPVAETARAGAPPAPGLQRRVLSTLADHTPPGGYEILELLYNLPAYLRLARAIRTFKPDFIYERYSLNTVAGIWAAKRFRVPLLLEVNSPLADEKRKLGKLFFYGTARRLERYAIHNATRTLAVTNVLKRMLVAGNEVPESRVHVIHNGVDPDRFGGASTARDAVRQRLGVGDALLIGAVGFFREWHGIDLLLRAVANVPELRASARTVLVGEGQAVPALRKLAQTLGIHDRVVFVGAVPHDDVSALIEAFDVVLLPRAVEYASPLKLFEYMAAQKAIVAPRQSNLQEVLTDGHDALLFSPEHPAELESTLVRLSRDEVLRRELGRRARATIDTRNLTWDGNASRIIQVFEEIANVTVTPRVLAGSRA